MRLGVRWRCDLQKLLVCFRSISLSRERLGVADAAMHSLGPAPSYAEKSAIQNRIAYLYNQHVAPQSRTYQEGEVSHVKMRARTRLLAAPCTARTRRRSSASTRKFHSHVFLPPIHCRSVPEEIAKASHRPGACLLETMRERIPESWRYLPSMDDQKQVD